MIGVRHVIISIMIILYFALLIPVEIRGEDKSAANKKENEYEKFLQDIPTKKAAAVNKVPGMKKKSDSIILNLFGTAMLWSSFNFAHKAPVAEQTDYRGFSSLKQHINLNLEVNQPGKWRILVGGKLFYDFIYDIKGQGKYTDEVLDAYLFILELDEAYLMWGLTRYFDFKVGRQIINWGKSSYASVVDVLNPRDYRSPYLINLKDLRLPVLMSCVDFNFLPHWTLSGIAVHEIRFNKTSTYGSDFYIFDTPITDEIIPRQGGKNTEFGLSLLGYMKNLDLGFYWSRFFDDRTYQDYHLSDSGRYHAMIDMIGITGVFMSGSFTFSLETALFNKLRYTGSDKEFSRYDLMCGVEYVGINDMVITFEAINQTILNLDEDLRQNYNKNEFKTILTITKSFLHSTFHIDFQSTIFGLRAEGGAYQRLKISYDLNDFYTIMLGAIFYQPGQWYHHRKIGDKDRLFFQLTYQF